MGNAGVAKQAEVRRIVTIAWAGAKLYQKKRDRDPTFRCETAEFLLALLKTAARG